MTALAADDIDRLARAAVDAGLAEPERLRMLRAGLPGRLAAHLPIHSRPVDQIRSDLTTLAGLPDGAGLRAWLIQADQIARDTHPLLAHLFARYAIARHAILAGADGERPATWVKAGLIQAGQIVDRGLGPGHRAQHVSRFEACDGAAALDRLEHFAAGPPVALLWVHLIGALAFERRRLRLRTADGQGMQLDELADVLAEARAARRVVIIDVDPETDPALLEKLSAVDLGPLTLDVRGPGVTEALADALASGARTAGELCAWLGARASTSAPDVILADAGVDRAPTGDAAEMPAIIEYLEGLHTRCARMALHVRDPKVGEPDRTYVPLYTASPVDGRDAAARARRGSERDDTPITVHDRAAAHRCLFIVGEPGSGKTTSLQRLCAALCDAHLGRGDGPPPGWMPERPLPVWVDLRDVPPPPEGQGCRGRDLLDHAFARLDRCDGRAPLDPRVADRALREGRLVLILDGLDEVPSPALRRAWADAITDLAATQARKARVWVSCRSAARAAGAEPGAPFVPVELKDFDRAQQERVVAGWLGARGLSEAERQREVTALLADLGRHPEVAKQAGVPLNLALICLLYFKGHGLPDSRVDLYYQLVDLFVRDRKRAGRSTVQAIEPHTRRAALTDLAWAWWLDGGGQVATGDAGAGLGLTEGRCVEIVDARLEEARLGADPVERRALASALVAFLDQRAGMLRWQGVDAATGQRRFGFAHRTFAEYLVACRLSEDAALRAGYQSERFARDPNWREVFVMFTALVGRAETGVRAPAWAWIEALVGWAEDAARPAEDRAAFARLAAECLAPCRERASSDVCGAVDGLQAILLDAERCAGFPAAQRIAFWEAIGAHNRLVGEPTPAERWVWLPGGRFWRGAAEGDEMAYDDERPAGWVELSPFAIQRWPVLVMEYIAFVEHGYGDPAGAQPPWWSEAGWAARVGEGWEHPEWWYPQRQGRPTHPVVGVSWWEAEAYARWLGVEVMGLKPEGVGLPSEAQWERAARGGGESSAKRRYPWGWDDGPDRRNDMKKGATPVGAFPGGLSVDGLWDMSGNVMEWCVDGAKQEWERLPYEAEPGRDPIRPVAPDAARRVLRGGAWHCDPRILRVSYRFAGHPAFRDGDFGFRCVFRGAPRSLGP